MYNCVRHRRCARREYNPGGGVVGHVNKIVGDDDLPDEDTIQAMQLHATSSGCIDDVSFCDGGKCRSRRCARRGCNGDAAALWQGQAEMPTTNLCTTEVNARMTVLDLTEPREKKKSR